MTCSPRGVVASRFVVILTIMAVLVGGLAIIAWQGGMLGIIASVIGKK